MNSYDVKIAMIAPSRSGKTTLISCMYHELQSYLSQRCVGWTYSIDKARDEEMQAGDSGRRIKALLSDFKANVDLARAENGCFRGQAILGSTSDSIFNFSLTYKDSDNDETYTLRLQFHDYPGGKLTDDDLDLLTQFSEADIVFVPIPMDVISEHLRLVNADESYEERRHKIAKIYELLGVSDVQNGLNRWINGRREKKQIGVIHFLPVKCEHYFHGGDSWKSGDMLEYVKSAYYTGLDLDEWAMENIRICFNAVETYGVAKYVQTSWDKDYEFQSIFKMSRKENGEWPTVNDIKTRGALFVLASSLFTLLCPIYVNAIDDLDRLITVRDNRGTWERFKDWWTGRNNELTWAIEKSGLDGSFALELIRILREIGYTKGLRPRLSKIFNEIPVVKKCREYLSGFSTYA